MPNNFFGGLSPWAWALEPVRGCNLSCGHCATRLLPKGKFTFVEMDVWEATWRIIGKYTPRCRVDLVQAGEPTLHPRLLELLWIARKLAPEAQIQITTNGTQLIQGKVTYKQLFRAGANVVYTDMYSPREKFIELAKQTGYKFYEFFGERPKDTPDCWTYHGPQIKVIVLMENPANWPKARANTTSSSGLRLGTFLNELDWEAAAKFGLKPVTEPLFRRCGQPFRYVATNVYGQYLLCCQDFMSKSATGNVLEGFAGFEKYWFGEMMQRARRNLRIADKVGRQGLCAQCNCVYSRADCNLWPEKNTQQWFDGEKWVRFSDDD